LQQDAAGGIVWSFCVLIFSIDILGFIFLGQGMYSIEKTDEKLINASKTLLFLLSGWICITILSRIFLLYYCLTSEGYSRGFPYTGFFETQDVGGYDNYHYIFSANLYLVTWMIALIFLILVTFQISRFLKIVDERVDTGFFIAFSFLNFISFLVLAILVIMTPLGGILILEGYVTFEFSRYFFPGVMQFNNLFLGFFSLKFVIIPIIGIKMFNKLRKMKLGNDLKEINDLITKETEIKKDQEDLVS
jgi:hypothetical protein